MPVYANNGGNSNVVFFHVFRKALAPSISFGGGRGSLDELAIDVEFGDGSIYTYTESSVGHANLQKMIQLANAGQGLNSFINRQVKYQYASKR